MHADGIVGRVDAAERELQPTAAFLEKVEGSGTRGKEKWTGDGR